MDLVELKYVGRLSAVEVHGGPIVKRGASAHFPVEVAESLLKQEIFGKKQWTRAGSKKKGVEK